MLLRVCLPVAVFTFVPLVFATSSQVALSTPVHAHSTTLIDALSADGNYTSLLRLLQRTRLVPAINRLNGSTLFAPTNDAIKKQTLWHTASLEDISLVDNIREKLRQQLLYHLLNYSIPELPSTQKPVVHKTLLFPHVPIQPPSKQPPPNPPWLPVPGGSLGGEPQRLRVAKRDGATWVGTDYFGNGGVQIVRPTVDAGNGILIGVDGVLNPPENLTHIVWNNPSLSYLHKILPSKLKQDLGNSSELTLFLPQDSAWSELDEVEKLYLESKFADDDVQKILSMHSVTKHGVHWSESFLDSSKLKTVYGNELTFHVTSNETHISNSTILEPDIYASNGVLHLVSSLLIPPGSLELTPEKYLLALNCTTFVSLLHSVDLLTFINSTNTSYTILAPRDDVIAYSGSNRLPERGSDELGRVLQYHFLPGHWTPKQLADGMLLETALKEKGLNYGRQVLAVSVTGSGDDLELTFGGAGVIGGKPLETNNNKTIIYLITRPLIPPLDPLQTALPSLQFSLFLASVFSSSLADKLRMAPSTTFLIPNNPAFAALGLVSTHLLLPSSTTDLEKMIQHHVVTEVAYLDSLQNGSRKTYPTLEGSDVQIERLDNGSTYVAPSGGWDGLRGSLGAGNMLTRTGVVHEISGVLLPRSLEITVDKLAQAAQGGTMASLTAKAGMAWVLNGTAPPPDSPWANEGFTGDGWTLLCPTDDSFKRVNMSRLWDDIDGMRRLVSQHLLPPSTLRATTSDPNRPISFDNSATYSTLLSRSSYYGDVVFRQVDSKNPQSGYVVGIKNARGTNGEDDWANVISWGRSTVGSGVGGVVQVDRLLVPYQPSWWVEYGPPAAVGVIGLLLMGAFFYLIAYLWRRDTGEATYEPVGGFDREDDD